LSDNQIIDLVNASERKDEDLYQEFLESRDREVFGILFRKYMALVFGVCVKYLGEKHLAQDATMEVFEKMLGYQPRSSVSNFRAYLFVIAKNHCLMKQRGEKVISINFSDADMESATYVHPIDEVNKKEDRLDDCLKQLKDLQKECIDEFYMKKKSYSEISSELHVTLNAVKSHIQNGKRNLKICLEAA
jgi:RNA polymerase sigma-70 factor (ECF subfamily)